MRDETEKDNGQTAAGISNDLKQNNGLSLFPSSCAKISVLIGSEIFILVFQPLTIDNPLQDPVTWYGINYAGTQITQWDFQNKGTLPSPAKPA